MTKTLANHVPHEQRAKRMQAIFREKKLEGYDCVLLTRARPDGVWTPPVVCRSFLKNGDAERRYFGGTLVYTFFRTCR